MERESSKKIAEMLYERTFKQAPIVRDEFRRLVITGLAALLRETDSIAYTLKQRDKNR